MLFTTASVLDGGINLARVGSELGSVQLASSFTYSLVVNFFSITSILQVSYPIIATSRSSVFAKPQPVNKARSTTATERSAERRPAILRRVTPN